MKQFVLKIIGFSVLVTASVLGVFCLADGSTDAMYLKFTTPKQNALVIGSSRAAQGIQPKHLNSVLKHYDIYNYAFQIPTSPYGEIYFESIKRKIDTTNKNGLFILEVNPWTIGLRKDVKTGEEFLSEKDGFIQNTKYVSLNPNIEYLMESYNGGYINILKDRNRKGAYQTLFVENDGWLHVTIESDIISTEDRTAAKIKTYKKKLESFQGASNYRKKSLVKTIQFLKKYGEVYLIRIPVIDAMLEVENELQPEFNKLMLDISKNYEIDYINMTPERKNYRYTDGNHLDVTSGAQFSLDLANKIKVLQNQ